MTPKVFQIARGCLLAVAVSTLVAGCGLESLEQPPLSAPSEFALSVTLTATPDQLPRDGSTKADVKVTVRDAQGKPVGGQRLTVGVDVRSAVLSANEVTTNAAGEATFSVTAPPASALAGSFITVSAIPVGTDISNAASRQVTILLLGAVNEAAPTPSFTVTPASPEVNQVTTLDASASTDEGATCGDVCTYTWDLGGEATRTGRIITYRFQTARIYNVALTVTDAAGASATARTNVTVTAAARPTVSFTTSPASPVEDQITTFTATTTVATNHRITRYDWNWGDGTTSQTSNASITHTFSDKGSFVVTVTVTDDLSQTASSTASVTVGSGVTASFTNSPTNATTADTVQFNGSDSTAPGGATIEIWSWDFGDGSAEESSSGSTASHRFAAARTYVVRLTVTDSEGREGTTTKTITISSP